MMPRRDDEIQLYALLRSISHLSSTGNRLVFRDELVWSAGKLGIPSRRAGYILAKWEKRGWWWTSSIAGGWFTERSPSAILAYSIIE